MSPLGLFLGMTVGSGGGGASPSPAPFATIANIGDSHPTYLGTASVTYPHWLSYPMALGRQQLSVLRDGSGLPYYASSGQPSTVVQSNNLPTALASGAQAVMITCGGNDYAGGRTSAQVRDTLIAMVDSVIANGQTPILHNIFALPSGQAAKSAWIVATNALLEAAMASRPTAIYVKSNDVLDTNGDGVANSDSYFTDSVHLGEDGQGIVGPYVASVLAPYTITSDFYSGIVWASDNPLMTDANVNGVADGWAIDAGTGKTVTPSIIARGGGLGNWQQLAITGTAANLTTFRYGFGEAAGNWQVGDVVEFVCEFETDNDLSALWRINPRLYNSAASVREAWSPPGGGTSVPRMASGIMRSPPYTIPGGTTSMWLQAQIVGTGTGRLGRMGLRKIS